MLTFTLSEKKNPKRKIYTVSIMLLIASVFLLFSLSCTPPSVQKSAQESTEPVLASKESTESTLAQPPQETIKIYTDTDGIYVVDYYQIKATGVKISEIDPRTFKLTLKGKEVPILVYGEEDGSFDYEDRIEFYGQFNRGSQTYRNLYSNSNVYILSWGSKKPNSSIQASFGLEPPSQRRAARMALQDGNPTALKNPAKIEKSKNSFEHLYKTTLHLEDDLIFRRGFVSGKRFEHWYWQQISAADQAPYKIYFNLAGIPSSEDKYLIREPGIKNKENQPEVNKFSLKINFLGMSHLPVNPDHHIILKINDQIVGQVRWDAQEIYLFERNDIPINVLRNGENSLELDCPGDPDPAKGKQPDVSFLDYFELEYPRGYEAANESLEFKTPLWSKEGQNQNPDYIEYVLSGFSSDQVSIYKTGLAKILNARFESYFDAVNRKRFRCSFVDRSLIEFSYIAVAEERKLTPSKIILGKPSNLHDIDQQADLIIITIDDFTEPANQLAKWKEEAHNLKTVVVNINDVYDEFSYGFIDAAAIRDFLEFAYTNWAKPAPQFVILLGDATVDYKNNLKKRIVHQFIPTYSWHPYTDRAASDSWFVAFQAKESPENKEEVKSDLDSSSSIEANEVIKVEDYFPVMHIGRLPVHTLEEARGIVEKIINYEKNSSLGPWRNNLLFISGLPKGAGANRNNMFRNLCETMIKEHVPPSYNLYKIYLEASELSQAEVDKVPDPESTKKVLQYINDGQTMVFFTGHGGGYIWEDRQLLTLDDVDLLTNFDKLPVIFSMSCFTGFFDEPAMSCIGEKLVVSPKGGAIAFLGASGKSGQGTNTVMSRVIFNGLFNENQRCLGELIDQAKIESKDRDMIMTYILIGDPSLRIGIPAQNVDLKTDLSVKPGQVIQIQGKTATLAEGQALIQLSDSENQNSLMEQYIDFKDHQFATELSLPKVLKSDILTIGCYVWNTQEGLDGIGFSKIVINKPYISSVQIHPDPPQEGQDIYVTAELADSDGLGKVILKTSQDRKNYQELEMQSEGQSSTLQSGQLYRSSKPIPIASGRRNFYYQIIAKDKQGYTAETEEYMGQLTLPANLYVNERTIKFLDPDLQDNSKVQIQIEVANYGQIPAPEVEIAISSSDSEGNELSLANKVIDLIEPGKTKSITLDWQDPLEGAKIEVVLDPYNKIPETSKKDNLASKEFKKQENLSPKEENNLQQQEQEAMKDAASCKFEPSADLEKNILVLERTSEQKSSNQADLKIFPLKGWSEGAIFKLQILEPALFNKEMSKIHFYYDENSYSKDKLSAVDSSTLKIFFFDELSSHWVSLPSSLDLVNKCVSAKVSNSGYYTLMEDFDREAPLCDLNLTNLPFTVISAVLVDPNALDLNKNKVTATLDGKTVSPDQYLLYSSDGCLYPKSAVFYYVPEATLENGKHNFTLNFEDTSANQGNFEISYKTSFEDFKQGQKNYSQNNYAQAILSFEKFLNQYPAGADGLQNQQALHALQECHKLSGEKIFSRGQDALAEKNLLEAFAAFQELTKLRFPYSVVADENLKLIKILENDKGIHPRNLTQDLYFRPIPGSPKLKYDLSLPDSITNPSIKGEELIDGRVGGWDSQVVWADEDSAEVTFDLGQACLLSDLELKSRLLNESCAIDKVLVYISADNQSETSAPNFLLAGAAAMNIPGDSIEDEKADEASNVVLKAQIPIQQIARYVKIQVKRFSGKMLILGEVNIYGFTAADLAE